MTPDRSRGGRPRKSEGPRVPYEEVDRLLVFGEVIPCDDGSDNTQVVFPSYRQLGDRYGVSHTVIAEYAKKHNIQRRRKEVQARIQSKAEQKLIEHRATALALSKDDELRIIDRYLAGFEEALGEGRVRFDNPADFNTMVRLKEFVQGNADSRQEIHASLSLEALQARHRKMVRTVEATPAERGEVQALPSGRVEGDSPEPAAGPPRGSLQEPTGGFGEPTVVGQRAMAVVAPRASGPAPRPAPALAPPPAPPPAAAGPPAGFGAWEAPLPPGRPAGPAAGRLVPPRAPDPWAALPPAEPPPPAPRAALPPPAPGPAEEVCGWRVGSVCAVTPTRLRDTARVEVPGARDTSPLADTLPPPPDDDALPRLHQVLGPHLDRVGALGGLQRVGQHE
jgi:hypothetical protein